MDIVEIATKSALVRSRIPGVECVINPDDDGVREVLERASPPIGARRT